MKSNKAVTFVFLLVLLPLFLSAGQSDDIMPVAEIKPGMEGYGLTVFEGTEPERFNVKVIAVLPKALPKQDMILVELSGHGLEESGVVAGMSGSPIYINGKIIGALAYAWGFSKKPIAGITPIENMLKDLEHPPEPRNVYREFRERETAKTPIGDMTPVTTPLIVSGVPQSVMGDLAEALEPYHLLPVRGGGSLSEEESPELKPGSAVGVSLVRGDIEMDAIGTVTYRVGDRILAFGHPFVNAGNIAFPMNGAKIFTVLPSLRISTKMGASLSPVGAIIQDRTSGIFGKLGEQAPMVPVKINIKNARTGYTENFNLELAWEPLLFVKLLDAVLKAGLTTAEPYLGENTVISSTELSLEGYPSIKLTDTFYNTQGPYNPAMLERLVRLIFNPFEEVKIKSADFNLTLSKEIQLAVIQRIWSEKDKLKPGETTQLHVVLKLFNGESKEYKVAVTAPYSAKSGDRFLVGAIGGREILPPKAPPVNFRGVIDFISGLYQATDLVVVQQMPTVGAIAEGYYLDELPPSAARILGQDNDSASTLKQDLKFIPISTDWVIVGRATLMIQVE